jgi:hypothetical protein
MRQGFQPLSDWRFDLKLTPMGYYRALQKLLHIVSLCSCVDFRMERSLCILYAIALTLKLHSNNAAGEIWKKAAKSFI